MKQALERIGEYFEEYRQSVEACRSAESFRPVDWKAAHSALGRLRERFLHEKKNLTQPQQAALQGANQDERDHYAVSARTASTADFSCPGRTGFINSAAAGMVLILSSISCSQEPVTKMIAVA
jgi:hypothetical protein